MTDRRVRVRRFPWLGLSLVRERVGQYLGRGEKLSVGSEVRGWDRY